MYTKDKAQRITLRLNEQQFEFIRGNADLVGVSPSEFIRMMVNAAMATSAKIDAAVKERLEGRGRENDKANINDQL